MRYKYIILFLSIAMAGCTNHKDGKGHINFSEKQPIKPIDTLTQSYYKNKYYIPNVVRLEPGNKTAFIYIDSLRFKPGLINKDNREEYYKKAIVTLPKDDVQVQRIIWALPEVQQRQLGDGGYSTIVTWIMDRPSTTTDKYIVELRQNNIEEMTPEKTISSFSVKLHPLEIQVANESGYYVPLKEWRTARK